YPRPSRPCVPNVPVQTFSVLAEPDGSPPFVPLVPVLRGTNSSGSPDPADLRPHGPDVPFSSGLFVLISAEMAGSRTSRTCVPFFPDEDLGKFFLLSADSCISRPARTYGPNVPLLHGPLGGFSADPRLDVPN
ncbi:hypothetical protein KI387_011249, partial [Taxus chinensis]